MKGQILKSNNEIKNMDKTHENGSKVRVSSNA